MPMEGTRSLAPRTDWTDAQNSAVGSEAFEDLFELRGKGGGGDGEHP